MSRISSASSTRAPSVHSLSLSSGSDPPLPEVEVLLLGSGWTGAFLLPLLQQNDISYAYTNQSGIKDDSLPVWKKPIKWSCPDGGESRLNWRKALKVLPSAKLVVVIMALKDERAARELVIDYDAMLHERGIEEKTRWCVLSSTGAWGAGVHSSSSPLTTPSPRSIAEARLLSTLKKQVTILHLAGLYGGATRHPLNWLPKVAGTSDKLLQKTSLHLIHGKDVAQAVLGVYSQHDQRDAAVWGKRWIVTDGKIYDWWKLAIELPSLARNDYITWVKDFQKEYGVANLPRGIASTPDEEPPKFLDRALDSSSFWQAIGKSPQAGPVEETDLPISSLTGLPVTTNALGKESSTSDEPLSPSSILPFQPTISKRQIDDLISCLKHEINREESYPLPNLIEGTNFTRFGLTHQKFAQLRKAWLDYLITPASASSVPTWSSDWKALSSLQHFLYPLSDLLEGSSAYNTQAGLHFVRVSPSMSTRSQRKVIPLLFLSGWPSTCFEHLNVAQSLANPGPDVPLGLPAFDCILPSHPGYLWSGSPIIDFDEQTGKATARFTGPDGDLLIADVGNLYDRLMTHLGFGRAEDGTGGYSLQATDWGSAVGRSMAVRHKNNVLSCHFNYLPSPAPRLQPSLVPKSLFDFAASKSSLVESISSLPRRLSVSRYLSNDSSPSHLPKQISNLLGLPSELSEKDAKKVARGLEFQDTGYAYNRFHATRPGTLGEALHSSPSALLAWVGEKYIGWTDVDPTPQEIVQVLTLWFTTSTMPRSIYAYRNRNLGGSLESVGLRQNYISQPTGYSDFPLELSPTPLEWARGSANVVWYREWDRGGHFACVERPVEMVGDIRDFFSKYPRGG